MCSFGDIKLKFEVSYKSDMFELSYDGICSFQYAVLEGEVEGERLRSRLRTGFKDQPRLINILLLNY